MKKFLITIIFFLPCICSAYFPIESVEEIKYWNHQYIEDEIGKGVEIIFNKFEDGAYTSESFSVFYYIDDSLTSVDENNIDLAIFKVIKGDYYDAHRINSIKKHTHCLATRLDAQCAFTCNYRIHVTEKISDSYLIKIKRKY